MQGLGLGSLIPDNNKKEENKSSENFSLGNNPNASFEEPKKESPAFLPAEPVSLPSSPAPVGNLSVAEPKEIISSPPSPDFSRKEKEPEAISHIFHIEVEKIKPNPYQPRRFFDEEALKELASSIREFGVLQPLVVTKNIKDTPTGAEVEYELIAGERRLMASKLAGLERVPVIIKNSTPKKEKLELAIIENLQRENLNPIESARAFSKLQDEYGMTQREIAARLGKSREVVANSMRLLSLPTYIQEAVSQGKIGESQARLLLSVSNLDNQQRIFEDLLKNNLSVRELKNRIVSTNARLNAIDRFTNVDPEIKYLEETLSELLGTKVKVDKNGETGKITISFSSAEELKNIIDKVKKDDEEL
ncbi:MAG: ParB/RepB/Spo0J family partition protein [Candidatus Pacebacteria bacterium]|nr:ParB/RepB/Spo0J family partition protein [Candidatus Paceibacterota bacterium]